MFQKNYSFFPAGTGRVNVNRIDILGTGNYPLFKGNVLLTLMGRFFILFTDRCRILVPSKFWLLPLNTLMLRDIALNVERIASHLNPFKEEHLHFSACFRRLNFLSAPIFGRSNPLSAPVPLRERRI